MPKKIKKFKTVPKSFPVENLKKMNEMKGDFYLFYQCRMMQGIVEKMKRKNCNFYFRFIFYVLPGNSKFLSKTARGEALRGGGGIYVNSNFTSRKMKRGN